MENGISLARHQKILYNFIFYISKIMSWSDAIVMYTELISFKLSQLRSPRTGSFGSRWSDIT